MTVADASVWVSRFVAEDIYHLPSRGWLSDHLAAGGIIVAPDLLLAEVAGALTRRTGDFTVAHRAVAALQRLRTVRLTPADAALMRLAA